MLNINRLIIDAFVAELNDTYQNIYGHVQTDYLHLLEYSARRVLEHIATTDSLYHNIEHTIMVAQAGQAILMGKQMHEGSVTQTDWLHVTLALLLHDIGFVRGLCANDVGNRIATGVNDETIEWPDGKSAAILTPYHVDRSKLFMRESFRPTPSIDIDVDLICECIERTRFPVPDNKKYQNTSDLPGLVRAADFIGQLADPDYLRKIPALFYEFEENGFNQKFGYTTPGGMRKEYANFFATTVMPYIQEALNYLKVTQEGQQWIAYLYGHVFTVQQQANERLG